MTYPHTGLQRILVGSTNPVLRATLRDQDGAVATSAVTVTCTITRADGTVVATARSATATSGVLTCALTTAEAATLDVLKAEWTVSAIVRATTWHRIVGGFIYDIADLSAMGSFTRTTAQLLAERDRISDVIEWATNSAWWPQYDVDLKRAEHQRIHVTRRRPLRTVRSILLDDITQSLTDIEIDSAAGVFELDYALSGLLTIGYEHGFSAPTGALREAALLASYDKMTRQASTITGRARSITNDLGITQQFGYAGKDHPTGIDEADAVIIEHRQDEPGIR